MTNEQAVDRRLVEWLEAEAIPAPREDLDAILGVTRSMPQRPETRRRFGIGQSFATLLGGTPRPVWVAILLILLLTAALAGVVALARIDLTHPLGRHTGVAFTTGTGDPNTPGDLYLMDTSGNAARFIDQDVSFPISFSADGKSLMTWDSPAGPSIYDVASARSSQTFVDRLLILAGSDAGLSSTMSWNPEGTAVAVAATTVQDEPRLYVLLADGSQATALDAAGSGPVWSPDGLWIAFHSVGSAPALFKIRPNGNDLTRLGPAYPVDPNTSPGARPPYSGVSWSPDSRLIAYNRPTDPADADQSSDIFIVNADGSGERDVSNVPGGDFFPHFSPDGTLLTWRNVDADGNATPWVVSVAGGAAREIPSEPLAVRGPNMPNAFAVWSPAADLLVAVTKDNTRLAWLDPTGASPTTYTTPVLPDGSTVSISPGLAWGFTQ
jgi:TolB protein